ncbi:interleukin-6-like isoform X1 [Syngnathus typhle]|uniref:interleukin-6-like isoform X1 n=1 Tax=Syngnathus typhle TaxID=161592 RepID=UPI002A6A0C99|nr:interleukin-6-like isoform X1 [Syngnathus typhle]
MPNMYTQILAVGLVAFLVLRANGAPLTEATTVLPSSDTSSEEETAPSDLLTSAHVLDSVLGTAKEHQKAFDDEFQNNVNFHLLEHYKAPQFPANCPSSNFSKEACLHRLAQGLSTYIILLKHVEKEYPGSKILSEAKHYSVLLLYNIKQKVGQCDNLGIGNEFCCYYDTYFDIVLLTLVRQMKKPEEVTGLSSNEEESLLRSLYHPDAFHRKMTAHNILRNLYIFIVDGKRALRRKERRRGKRAKVFAMFSLLR